VEENVSRRYPAKVPVSLRLPRGLARWVAETLREDSRFYSRSHLIEEALLAFRKTMEQNGKGVTLVEQNNGKQ
jgi:Arc/MetJ-type ribon-helix-helix transcriptional regulator